MFSQCFYFGVPTLVCPIIVDQASLSLIQASLKFSDCTLLIVLIIHYRSLLQINNASRIEETGFGFRMDIMNFESDELVEKLEKLLTDKALRKKWSDASRRIQKENRILSVVDRLVNYVEKL